MIAWWRIVWMWVCKVILLVPPPSPVAPTFTLGLYQGHFEKSNSEKFLKFLKSFSKIVPGLYPFTHSNCCTIVVEQEFVVERNISKVEFERTHSKEDMQILKRNLFFKRNKTAPIWLERENDKWSWSTKITKWTFTRERFIGSRPSRLGFVAFICGTREPKLQATLIRGKFSKSDHRVFSCSQLNGHLPWYSATFEVMFFCHVSFDSHNSFYSN